MARHLEIERKFLVKRLPAGWKRHASSRIVQGYFPVAAQNLEIRLRRNGSQNSITIKSGHGRRRLEEELGIPKTKFQALWRLTATARVAKRRYRIPCRGRTIEMDVYEGRHRGLRTAEVEFSSVRQSRSFQPPDWLGREITGHRQYTNAELARRGGLPRQRTQR